MYRGGAYREVLEVREARALIGASAASQIGDWLYNAALLSYVYLTTGSAWWVGTATIFRLLPYVLLGPVGGLIADRYRRRTVLICGDLLRLATMLALGAVVASDGPVQVVIALTALVSAAGTAERPAAIALLPRFVGEMRLGAANALLHTVQDLGVVVGCVWRRECDHARRERLGRPVWRRARQLVGQRRLGSGVAEKGPH